MGETPPLAWYDGCAFAGVGRCCVVTVNDRTMNRRTLLIGALVTAAVLITIILLTAALTPQQTNPAYAAAVAFAEAAGEGDDATATALMGDDLRAYVEANCPDGSVSACVESYIPDEWGGFQSVVFRRAAPDASRMQNGAPTAYDVDLIATYAEDRGFSGVCIYVRMEQTDASWRVMRYAGFVSCGDAESRNMASNPDAPNIAP